MSSPVLAPRRQHHDIPAAEARLQELKKKSETAARAAEAKLADVVDGRSAVTEAASQARAHSDKAKESCEEAKGELTRLQVASDDASKASSALRNALADTVLAAQKAARNTLTIENLLTQAERAADIAERNARVAAQKHKVAVDAYWQVAETNRKSKKMPASRVGNVNCVPPELSSALSAAKIEGDSAYSEAQKLRADSKVQEKNLKLAKADEAAKERLVQEALKKSADANKIAAGIRRDLEPLQALRDEVCAACDRARNAADELETVNVVRPHIEVTVTDAKQFVEVWITETKPGAHAFKKGGDLQCDSANVEITRDTNPFDGKATNGELKSRKKFPFTASAAGIYTFTLSLEDPADALCLVEQNPVNDKASLLTILVIDVKPGSPILDIKIKATIEGAEAKLISADTPIRKWLKDPTDARIDELKFTDPEDYTWDFIVMTS